jgi:hypothetical protein
MEPPDHDSVQSSSVGFQSHEIAYTTFIESSAIVDHQHIAPFSHFERLQENIDAADMSGGRRATSYAATRDDSLQERWRTAHRDLSASARIRHMCRAQCRKPPPSLVVIHGVCPRSFSVSLGISHDVTHNGFVA